MKTDSENVRFLQWCLPKLHLRWPGFRKVRRHVYKRVTGRLKELGLPGLEAYRLYLQAHPDEWAMLDSFCWINISRFFRDRAVFEHLANEVLPQLAQRVIGLAQTEILCWSAGCAAGEEPYTLSIIGKNRLSTQFPQLRLRIVATDIDQAAIRRAERACYRASSLRDLPAEWRTEAFVAVADELCLKTEYRRPVTFVLQDIRAGVPEGRFHLVLCRNLVFTYFDEVLQRRIMQRLSGTLAPGGVLVIGSLESIPDGPWGVQPWSTRLGIYQKTLETQRE